MVFYSALFLSFFYFKIARVYKKEEKSNTNMLVQNLIVFVAILALFYYGFTQEQWYMVVITSWLFLIVSSLIISAIQVGVFLNGKPFVKISHLYKVSAPIGMLIAFSSVYLLGL